MNINNIIEWYKGKRILITGGSGYLASNLVCMTSGIPCTIILFDQKTGIIKEPHYNAEIINIKGDICDRSIWEKLLTNVDVVFHFAAQTSTYKANQNPADDAMINVLPMVQMLDFSMKSGNHPTIVFAGTATQVGLTRNIPVNESEIDHPLTIYDLHKNISEQYLKYFCHGGIVKGTILRLANVYGPGPKSSNSDRGILNMMVRTALAGNDLTLYGEGNFIRDYVFVSDVIRAFLHAPPNISALNGKHFLIGSGKGHTLQEAFSMVVATVEKQTGKRAGIRHIDPPTNLSPIESRNFIANISNYCKATLWKPEISLDEGIQLTMEAML